MLATLDSTADLRAQSKQKRPTEICLNRPFDTLGKKSEHVPAFGYNICLIVGHRRRMVMLAVIGGSQFEGFHHLDRMIRASQRELLKIVESVFSLSFYFGSWAKRWYLLVAHYTASTLNSTYRFGILNLARAEVDI